MKNSTFKTINVEVAYAKAEKQIIKKVQLTEGSSIQKAIELSQIINDFPEIDLKQQKVGIFSKVTNLDTPLRDKDRVEIYRELLADPKAVRRAKLAKKQI